ncbi:MAG: class I SAM-dependent RNA methyltransferase [Sphaerochaetaceae bacterium]
MTVRCEKLIQGGLALSHGEKGQVILVKGALPGELVEIQLDEKKSDYLVCHVTTILEASPDRVEPLCPYYGICGGCDFQMLASAKQSEIKQLLVEENLRRIAGLDDLETEPVASGPMWNYRSRCRFHIDVRTKQIGFLGKRTNSVLDIKNCPVLVPQLNQLLLDRTFLWEEARKAMFSNKVSNGLVEVNVFCGDKDVTCDQKIVLATIGGHTFAVDGRVFFQGNAFLLPQMGSFVQQQTVGSIVMDLYGGVGTFSKFLGAERQITLVERDPNCLRLAKRNVPFASLYTQDVAQWKQTGPIDTVVVDPPRVGLADMVPAMIASWKPARIIYMSCDSVSLARDVSRFAKVGYTARRLKVFDMYPQTFGQEACVVLDGKESANA